MTKSDLQYKAISQQLASLNARVTAIEKRLNSTAEQSDGYQNDISELNTAIAELSELIPDGEV